MSKFGQQKRNTDRQGKKKTCMAWACDNNRRSKMVSMNTALP